MFHLLFYEEFIVYIQNFHPFIIPEKKRNKMSSEENNQPDNNDSIVSIRGIECCVHRWKANGPTNDDSNPKALIVLYHGFLAHGRYPTVRYAAEFFALDGYAVVAIDFPGHGRSQGMKGYLKSANDLIEGGVLMAEHAQSLYRGNKMPLVLCGSSMGGAIALSVVRRLSSNQKDSSSIPPIVIMMAPMLKLNVSSFEHTALRCLAFMTPTLKLIPSSSTDSSKQYRDEKKRKECEDDAVLLSDSDSSGTNNKIRVASALTCVDITLNIATDFDKISNPYLLLIADEDVVVKNEGSEEFHTKSSSQDKTKINYPALHGLLCEPSPLFDNIKDDILNWLNKRTSE